MILQTLNSIKISSEKNIENESKKIETANSIEKLLNQIDFTTEIVPTENLERLRKLFTSLKNEELNSEEIELLSKISKLDNNDKLE